VPVLEQVLEKYPEEVKIVFKNFPLRNHKFAMKAAIAALGADSSGKFWEFHDLLFKNYNRLNDQMVGDFALALGLDSAAFERTMKDPGLQGRIRQDVSDGRQAGVDGTPTVFINGRLLKNGSLKGFQMAIDQELKKLDKEVAKPAS
jgi:protein-disulfide isomerase